MSKFCHLHCHTQYSLLDGAAKITSLIEEVKKQGMQSIAITDHGNMFGVAHFVNIAKKNNIKPIIGCEFYLADDMYDMKNNTRYHQILIAKDEIGYKNLSILCSLGFTEGYYYKPRIDLKKIKKYSQGLIATTCCLGSKVCQSILKKGEKEAEKIFLEWLEIFGSDYYIELQRHGLKEMDHCVEILLKWSKKYNVKTIATNDVHYVKQEDSIAQDILLCLQTGRDYNDPNRMRFLNDQFYLKKAEDMQKLFIDVPEAISNTLELDSKIKTLSLTRDVLLPIFKIPNKYNTQDEYLRYLTFEGAKKIYKNISEELKARINLELHTIQSMGFSGYFLIVQDFINAAKKLNVLVGPGRGSVAGSVVAYSLGITDIDPIKYNLFFERFLNPERISMPDIDIDFDDEGRQKVINYVIDKYGKNQVAQIITFGSMAAKSSIRDVSRVLGVPLKKADYIAKLIPDKPGITLAKAFTEVEELAKIKNDIVSQESKVLNLAATLEGSARHTGLHAAGIIIAPDDITKYIPVKTDKESDLLVTQYDGSVIESLGMLKMDFLGLKTLSIIKDTLKLIKKRHNIDIDIRNLPLNDEKTFKLYQKGDTIATFQFESEGMRNWLQKLHPTNINDLMAMNALYRPGPMQFIPNFIDRKHGKEKIEYPHVLLESILKDTYGIMVYQEQIMQTAQIIGGYTLAGADILRKAMGKKKIEEMAKQKTIFIEGAKEKHKINEKTSSEIFSMMDKFAQYGFNRSHSAAYSIIAYQTAYLKTHFSSEYMASVLTHNQSDIAKISYFMDECKRQNIKVLGPDINESSQNFDVNKNSMIRFGLAAIKGAGDSAISTIIEEQKKNGHYKNIYDFIERINLRKVNKKTIEALAISGAFDSFEYPRKSYISTPNNNLSFTEQLIKYGNKVKEQKNSLQQSLFGLNSEESIGKKPVPIENSEFTNIEKLKKEKEYVGFYVSGHPLDQFKIEIDYFCNCNTQNFFNLKTAEAKIAGIVTDVNIRQTKKGQYFCIFTLEDYYGSISITLFGQNFRKNEYLLHKGEFLYIIGTIQEKYNDNSVLEIKPKSIQSLHEIRDKLVKSIKINVPLQEINIDFINKLENILKENQGTKSLKLNIYSKKDDINVECTSTNYNISSKNKIFEKFNEANISFTIEK